MKLNRFILFCLILLIIGSCAPSSYRQGVKAIRQKNYSEAIQLLKISEMEDSENFKIKRDLGYVYFLDLQFQKAIEKLSEAQLLNNSDGNVIFYLGISYELTDKYDLAIEQYKNYTKVSRWSSLRNIISNRIRRMVNKKNELEIEKAIANEKTLDVAGISDSTLALMYFQNLGKNKDVDLLLPGLIEIVSIDLSKIKSLRIVERLKFQKLLKVLEFDKSEFVDAKTAPRLGKLLKAGRLISGSFLDLEEKNIRIDANIIQVKDEDVKNVPEVVGNLDEFLALEKKLVFKIIEQLGITLSTTELEEIKKQPTSSMLAFLAYSQGLDFEYKGQFDKASKHFEQAIKIDPNFRLAKDKLDEVTELRKTSGSRSYSTGELVEEFQLLMEVDMTESEKLSRLQLDI